MQVDIVQYGCKTGGSSDAGQDRCKERSSHSWWLFLSVWPFYAFKKKRDVNVCVHWKKMVVTLPLNMFSGIPVPKNYRVFTFRESHDAKPKICHFPSLTDPWKSENVIILSPRAFCLLEVLSHRMFFSVGRLSHRMFVSYRFFSIVGNFLYFYAVRGSGAGHFVWVPLFPIFTGCSSAPTSSRNDNGYRPNACLFPSHHTMGEQKCHCPKGPFRGPQIISF